MVGFYLLFLRMVVQVLMQWMVVMLLEFSLVLSSNCSQVTTKEPGSSCSLGQFGNGSTYESNRRQIFSRFQNLSGINNSDIFTYGETSNRIFGLFQCDKDVKNKDDCYFCITGAEDTVRKVCHEAESAYVWKDNCFLRYSMENFTSTLDNARETLCEGNYNGSRPQKLADAVEKLFGEMNNRIYGTKTAVPKDEFSAYGKAVCSSDLSPDDCERCLQESKSYAKRNCSLQTEVDIWSGSCRLNYHISYPGRAPSSRPPPGPGGKTEADNTTRRNGLDPSPSIAPTSTEENPPGSGLRRLML